MGTPNLGLSIAQQMLQDGSLPDKPNTGVPMRAVVSVASTLNPDTEAKTQQLAGQAGMPVDLTRSNPDAARQRALAADLERRELEIRNPILASQLRDPNFAGVAHDDLDSLTRIEQHAGFLGRSYAEIKSLSGNINAGVFSPFKSLIDAAGVGVQAGMETPGAIMSGLTGLDPEWSRLKHAWVNPRHWAVQDAVTNPVQSWLTAGVQPAPSQYVTDPATGGITKNPDYRWWGRPLVNSIEQVPGTLAAFALTGKLGGIAGEAAAPAAVIPEGQIVPEMLGAQGGAAVERQIVPALLGTQSAQTTYAQARAKGADQKTAVLAAIEAGMTNYAFMGQMPGPAPTSSLAGTVGQWAGRSTAFGTGMAVSDNAIAQSYDPGRGLFEDVPQSILTMAAYEGVGAFQRGWANIADAAEASKLRTRSPEIFKRAMDANFEGQESLRIPAQEFVDYFTEKKLDPAMQAARLGVTNLEEAAAAGTDLEIPKANFVARLEPEHQRGLIPDLVDPSTGMTARQGEAGKAELQEWANNGGIEKLAAEYAQADAETQASPEYQQLHDVLKDRYAQGGVDEAKAEAAATLNANVIAGFARKNGQTLAEAQALYAPEIVQGDAPGAASVAEKFLVAPNGEDYFGEITPEVAQVAGIESGKIRLRGGDATGGLAHIEERRGDSVKERFGSIQNLVHYVANNYDAIYESATSRQGTAYDIVVNHPPEKMSHGRLIVRIEKDSTGNYYDVRSAMEMRPERFKNRTPLWERAGASTPDGQATESPLGPKGQSVDSSVPQNEMGVKDTPAAEEVQGEDRVLFQSEVEGESGAAGKRGWFRILPDGRYQIGKTYIGDVSTFIHEPAHAYLEMFRELTQRETASEPLKDDFKKICDWLGMSPEEAYKNGFTTEQHEQWAKANEQYVSEGKAPTPKLARAFQLFALWLKQIYSRAPYHGVEISPEVRGAMDRMYAGEEAVDRAGRETGEQLFRSPEEAGWTEEQYKNYAASKGLAVTEAKTQLIREMHEAWLREKTENWREEKSNVRDVITEQVDARPEYRAIRSLRRGTLDDGTELTLNRNALVKQFGEERVAALQAQHRGLYRAEGGTDAETAAEILGHNSGEEMMRALTAAPRRAAAIEAATRETMTERHGDIRYDGTLDDKARLAVENDERAKALHKELAALKKKVENLRGIVEGSRIAPLEVYEKSAHDMIGMKPIADLQPYRYLNASRKFSREAFEAFGKGDAQRAVDAKNKELLNHFLFREASKAKEEAESIVKAVRRYSSSAKVREKIAKAGGAEGQHVYLDQIDNILEAFKFVPRDPAASGQRQSFLDFAAQKQAEANQEFFALNPDWVADHPNGEMPEIATVVDTSIAGMEKAYRELTIEELRTVRDALKNVKTLARNALGFLRDGHLVSFDQEVADLERVAREANKVTEIPRSGAKLTGKEKAIQKIHGWDAYMQKMEWFVDRLDGGDINGPARRNIKKPVDDANGESLRMGDEIFGKLKALLGARPKEDVADLEEMTGVQFPLHERPLTRSQLISWALNLGTEENQKVALIGEGLVNPDGSLRPEVGQAMRLLRKSEWELVQGVWDILDGMLPAVKAKALRTTGIDPKLKKVVPFDVTSVEGDVVHMRGGYYPLKGEPGERIGMMQNDPAKTLKVGYQRPTTNKSHLKHVTGATYKLDLNYQEVLSKHFADVINDTTKGEAISQVYKFISNDRVRETIRQTLGDPESREFLKWLQDFAGNNTSGGREGGKILSFLASRRSGMVVARLGGNLGSYLIQSGDVFKSFADPDIKTKYLAKAFLDIRRNPTRMIQEIRDLSPNEMRFREKNFNREIRDMLVEKGPFDQKRQLVTDFLMQGFAVMDRLVTFPAWLARYRQGFEEHGDSARAAMEADRAIARDYQAGDPRNMSHMMREGGLMRLLTTFQGDANTWYGIISAAVRSGNKRAISVGLFALIAEQVVGQLIKNRGPKDDESWPGWLIEQALLAGSSKVPVIGDGLQYGLSKGMGKYASIETPTTQALEKVYSVPLSVRGYVLGTKDEQQLAQDLFEATGIWVGIPGTSQAVRTWKYIHKVQTGEAQPESMGEAVLGAVMGARK